MNIVGNTTATPIKESQSLFDTNSITKEKSNALKVMRRIDNFLNLGSLKDLDFSDFSKEEKEQFYKALAKLLQEGIIGYKYYDIDGKLEKHFLVNTIGDKRLYRAKTVNEKEYC
jgi:hypothetical protein